MGFILFYSDKKQKNDFSFSHTIYGRENENMDSKFQFFENRHSFFVLLLRFYQVF